MSHKILRLPDVIAKTGLSRSTIYKRMANQQFPSSVSLGVRAVGWLESDVELWVKSLLTNDEKEGDI